MDADQLQRRHRHHWDRLATLVRRAGRDPSALDPDELDELVGLYRRVGGHLSTARTRGDDPALVADLTRLVARANSVVYGTRARTRASITRSITSTFPAAVWHLRREVLAATLLLLGPALAVGTWIAVSPAALEATGTPALREAYVEEDFEAYYSSGPAQQFAADIAVNNASVGALAFGVGIAASVPTALVLAFNGANVGVAAGLFHAAGVPGRFWGLILPHGLLELTAVVIAGATGLRLGWTLLAPGDRSRTAALADEGTRAAVVVAGLIVVFAFSALVEAFVTPSGFPTTVRVGIGVAVWLGFGVPVVVLGRAAAATGRTGRMAEDTRLVLDGTEVAGGLAPVPSGRLGPGPSSGLTPGPSSGLTPGPSSGLTPGPSSGLTPGPSSGLTPDAGP